MRDGDNGNLEPYWSPLKILAWIAVYFMILFIIGTLIADWANAAAPQPVRATSAKVVKRVARRSTIEQPAPLTLGEVATALNKVAGAEVVISCDTPGVPSPIDGHVLDFTIADGEVFLDDQGNIANVLHVGTQTCWDAQRANRIHEANPSYISEWNGRRTDESSGRALEVLLHEAIHHALNSEDEGLVECTAVSNAWPLANLVGHSAWDAGLLYRGELVRHAQHIGIYRTVC